MVGLLSWGIHLSKRALDDRFAAWEAEREATVRLMLEQIYDEMLLLATVFSHDRDLHELYVQGRNAVLAEGGAPVGWRPPGPGTPCWSGLVRRGRWPPSSSR